MEIENRFINNFSLLALHKDVATLLQKSYPNQSRAGIDFSTNLSIINNSYTHIIHLMLLKKVFQEKTAIFSYPVIIQFIIDANKLCGIDTSTDEAFATYENLENIIDKYTLSHYVSPWKSRKITNIIHSQIIAISICKAKETKSVAPCDNWIK